MKHVEWQKWTLNMCVSEFQRPDQFGSCCKYSFIACVRPAPVFLPHLWARLIGWWGSLPESHHDTWPNRKKKYTPWFYIYISRHKSHEGKRTLFSHIFFSYLVNFKAASDNGKTLLWRHKRHITAYTSTTVNLLGESSFIYWLDF